jgi:LysR family transcriptional regulator, glycine cleavage system transcriptional activator
MSSSARLPLATLPTFRAVARLNNLRAAAEELSLTHSAVSQQMRQLEDRLGFALFTRHGRRIVLNPAGAALQRAVDAALDRLNAGAAEAQALASGQEQVLRLTVLPSFAQRWLLPRMGRWRERHPGVRIELHSSLEVVDLVAEGFHAALRVGQGPWRGLDAEPLLQSPLVAVAAPAVAERIARGSTRGSVATVTELAAAIAREPLLGDAVWWEQWFAASGCTCTARPVADFNDAGLMLQAAELGLGIALGRELLAADAIAAGRLCRLSPVSLDAADSVPPVWWVARPEVADWPPLRALRGWLFDEVALSRQRLADEAPAADGSRQ